MHIPHACSAFCFMGKCGTHLYEIKKEYTKKCTRGGAPLHELLVYIRRNVVQSQLFLCLVVSWRKLMKHCPSGLGQWTDSEVKIKNGRCRQHLPEFSSVFECSYVGIIQIRYAGRSSVLPLSLVISSPGDLIYKDKYRVVRKLCQHFSL